MFPYYLVTSRVFFLGGLSHPIPKKQHGWFHTCGFDHSLLTMCQWTWLKGTSGMFNDNISPEKSHAVWCVVISCHRCLLASFVFIPLSRIQYQFKIHEIFGVWTNTILSNPSTTSIPMQRDSSLAGVHMAMAPASTSVDEFVCPFQCGYSLGCYKFQKITI